MADLPKMCVYDRGSDSTIDRYTIVLLERASAGFMRQRYYTMLVLSRAPTHPTYGISQWTEGELGDHLGQELGFDYLPEELRLHVRARLAAS